MTTKQEHIDAMERIRDDLIEERGAMYAAIHLAELGMLKASEAINEWVDMRAAVRDESPTMKAYRDGEEAVQEMRGGLDRAGGLGG